MNTMDLPEIPGFNKTIWMDKSPKPWSVWYSNFSPLEIHQSGKGYRITHDDAHPFKGAYYDTLEEAVYHVRYRAISNFLGDEY